MLARWTVGKCRTRLNYTCHQDLRKTEPRDLEHVAPVPLILGAIAGATNDPDLASYCLLLDVFDGIVAFGLGLLRLAGKAITLVPSNLTSRILSLALDIFGAGLDVTSRCGQGHGGRAEEGGT